MNRTYTSLGLILGLTGVLAMPAYSGSAAETAILPPELPWSGASQSLVVPKSDPWITPSEAGDLKVTPAYDETVAWVRKLVDAAPELEMVSLGKSAEGRDLWMVIASADQAFTAEALRASGKPILLAQGCIHSGESDGKDAGLMFLRDLTVRGTKKDLLQKANFLFVPIYSVDAHEHASKFGRVNQRGPEVTGWRTNSRNLNLNRDYAKLDSPEARAMIRALGVWQPDLYLDLHVTDGADYQYDITWAYSDQQGYSPAIADWLDAHLAKAWTQDLKAAGHIPGIYVDLRDELDPTKGRAGGPDAPRFSTGYGAVRHLPTVLLETHSLKPYAQRVLGTYVFLESALRTLGQEGQSLRTAIEKDKTRLPKSLVLSWKQSETESPLEEFLGVDSRISMSAISGGLKVEWLGKPVTLQIPGAPKVEPDQTATRPKAYWIPPQWPELIERLQIHGVQMERLTEARQVEVELLRIEEFELAKTPFEGHIGVAVKKVVPLKRTQRFPAGSVRIPADQPLGDLVMILLEPASADSFFAWGFLLEVLQQTEYIEAYVMEPMAEKMLAEDPKLAAEFQQKLRTDEAFRASPRERLQWLYSKTPFFDDRWRVVPIGREL